MSTFPEDGVLSRHGLKAIETKANLEQMFLLIESILPFEACLYYQVLPLSIEGSSLHLGMVNPDDTSAADYVRRQVSYINCSIVPQSISSDWHREILSKFLSHSAKNRQAAQQAAPPQDAPSFSEQPTLVVGAPTEIIERGQVQKAAAEPPVAPKPPLQIDFAKAKAKPDPQPANETLPELPDLNQLTPRELTQTLLKQLITQEGIGRLYLERQQQGARILWSKDGVVQSVMGDISSQLFQGVINELKRMMSLALIPVRKPKQVEIERIHNQKRILLRLRVMPGEYGEAATLQILRGAALKFYQQQQIDSIGRDALALAQDLKNRIDDLRTQAQRHLDVQSTKQKTLPAIVDMLQEIEQQLQEIMQAPDD